MVKKLDFLTVQESRNGSKLHCEIRLKQDGEPALPAVVSAPPEPETTPEAPVRKKRSPRKSRRRRLTRLLVHCLHSRISAGACASDPYNKPYSQGTEHDYP